jgi:hypothetical protein
LLLLIFSLFSFIHSLIFSSFHSSLLPSHIFFIYFLLYILLLLHSICLSSFHSFSLIKTIDRTL